MAMFYFPTDEKGFEDIAAFSPLDHIVCQRKPFGDIAAEEYIEYAQVDLERGDELGLIDALSNAKRCFHYQIDRLLYRYALRKISSASRFPEKLKLLSDLHIIPGTLLRVFNRERNEMEHDYLAPAKETVEGSIDLCELLLLASERFLESTPGRIRIKFKNDDRDLIVLLEPGSDRIKFFEVLGTESKEGPNGKYFAESIYDLHSDNEPKLGIGVNRIEKDDIQIISSQKVRWMPILILFSTCARNPGRFSTMLPDEPMVTIQHFLPWKELKQAFEKASS